MCGIVGYIGSEQAAPILLEGLCHLEYRGYDSAGIAVRDGSGEIRIAKTRGKVAALRRMLEEGRPLQGCCGIGHTRWATHGAPDAINAHPHASDDGNVAAVHNGIIENHARLRQMLEGEGYRFSSDTDTEAAVKLIDHHIQKHPGDPVEAIALSLRKIRGSYALALMFRDHPGEIYAVRRDSPLIIGVHPSGACLASDTQAILAYTRTIYTLENMEIARLNQTGVSFFDMEGRPVEKLPGEFAWNFQTASRKGFAHFMLKEIHEQPCAVRDTIASLIHGDHIDLSSTGLSDARIRSIRHVWIAACGSAWHAGLALRDGMQDLARMPAHAYPASEFRYHPPLLEREDLLILISQSGETADSLAALRLAKDRGIPTLAIVNVPGSTIAREADHVLFTRAGAERAVATTKAYSAQLAAGHLLALHFARVRGRIAPELYADLLAELQRLPEKIQTILQDDAGLRRIAKQLASCRDAFFIGRGTDCAAAMEGSLKLKEVAYIHSEAYAAGELKHGSISLIEEGTPVIAVMTQPGLREKMLSNMAECKSRGACLLAVTAADSKADIADYTIPIPETDPRFASGLAVVPLQLLAYFVGLERGLDVDQPRNLAKSVTVE